MKKTLSILSVTVFLLTFLFMPYKKSFAAPQNPITRSEAEKRALNIINLKWTYSKNKNGNISADKSFYVTQPSQFKDVVSGVFTGIPYNWGGLDSIDTYSYNAPWTSFLDAIEKGAFAGNVNTQSGMGYISQTAGLDCSGFVQAVFNIKDWKLSTSTLFNSYFTKIDIKDLKHMDILNKPGDHVVIFDRWGSLNGVDGAFTYESTTDTFYGGIQGTKCYFLSMKEINNGYIAGRYNYIIDDSQQSTIQTTSSLSGTTQSETLPKPVDTGIFAQISDSVSLANLRSAPSTSASIITALPKGTIIYIVSYSSGWYQVSVNGQKGYVWGSLISPIPSGKYVTVKGVTQLNIRLNPSSTSPIIGVLKQGQYAMVLDYSSSGTWYKININGTVGWAYSSYLSYIY
ncbi:SH3 domain-containing protein [Caloramator sp. E03]|uniref:SH3 domain-containing protein n=1 Tax=Caloramator sp. E03 TaxID=2576307 RepID=UPI0011102E17|nr:SH3 domain-containing protein [Caloramator sp. E03]QCX33552.1 SH3 domain-containing protein [Caloramator sp. E03]